MAKRPARAKQAFFIQRKSHVDDSAFFSDEGRRVYFDKACWAQWIMPNIDADQDPHIVHGPAIENDMSYQEWLEQVGLLGTTVTVVEYLVAVEQTIRDVKAGKKITDRDAMRFSKWYKRRRKRRGR